LSACGLLASCLTWLQAGRANHHGWVIQEAQANDQTVRSPGRG
jgi:hypothetical protein